MQIPTDEYIVFLAKELSGKCCLITGASGFIGRNLMATLLDAGVIVHITLFNQNLSSIPRSDEVAAHYCDLGNYIEVVQLFSKVQPEYLFHLATARGNPIKDRSIYIRNNILVADNIIRVSINSNIQKIIITDSSTVYGTYNYPIKESDALNPKTLHGTTNASSSLLFQEAFYSYKLPIVILRLFAVYGYGQQRNKLIPETLNALYNNTPLTLTQINYHRDYIFVTDVLEALVKAAVTHNTDGEVFNIASGVETSNQEVVNTLQELAMYSLTISKKNFNARESDTIHWCADIEKADQQLKWRPRHNLRDGLLKTWEWYKREQIILQNRSRNV